MVDNVDDPVEVTQNTYSWDDPVEVAQHLHTKHICDKDEDEDDKDIGLYIYGRNELFKKQGYTESWSTYRQ